MELFNRLGIGAKATEFWQAARAKDLIRAQRLLREIEQVLARSGNLRAAAGTLARMKGAVETLLKAAEVAPQAISSSVTLTEEGATLLEGAGGEVLADEAPLVADGPPGWAIIAVTLVIVLLLAAAAHADEKPKKQGPPQPWRMPERNPFLDLPPALRDNPATNPVAKLNQEAPRKLEEYQKKIHKKCRCYGGAPLGGNIAGRQLAMEMPMAPPASMCTWPHCPVQRRG